MANFLKKGLRKPVLRLYADRGKVVVKMRGGSDNRLADLARYTVLKSDVVKRSRSSEWVEKRVRFNLLLCCEVNSRHYELTRENQYAYSRHARMQS